ncbi:MAG: hypothetical protein GX607_23030 [Myxococcales bacterium]|nr:hypothetical protein [Myxococcales bacterium]
MWVRQSAIRPVPAYARVSAYTIEAVRESLMLEDDDVRAELDDAFERFERTQPALAGRVAEMLNEPLDETALALGYFLTIAVWLAFERAYGGDMDEVTDSEIDATVELLELDEELRRSDPRETLDSDDVIGMEQPNLLEFLHEHIDATLDVRNEEVDVDDVHAVYRLVLVELLALSYAVRPPAGYPAFKSEALA